VCIYVRIYICMYVWKEKEKGPNGCATGNKRKKISAKVLRYFPLKSRLLRMFMSSKIVEHV